jgi:hypothetical protein
MRSGVVSLCIHDRCHQRRSFLRWVHDAVPDAFTVTMQERDSKGKTSPTLNMIWVLKTMAMGSS